MKSKSLKMLLMIALTMSLFSAAFQSPAVAQQTEPEIKVLQKLDDGSIAISIDGQKYLAITRAHLDSWEKLQIDYDGCELLRKEDQKQITTLQHKWELAVKDVATVSEKAALHKADFEKAREDAQRNFGLFMSERQLRAEAQQFIPRGSGGNRFFEKLLDFLDKPAVQATFKLGLPIYQSYRCS